MELHCVNNDIMNTDMLDSRNQPLYRIATSSSWTSSGTTTISRMVPNNYGQLDPVVIAQVEWHSWSQPTFRFRGLTVKADNYINSKGFWNRSVAVAVSPRDVFQMLTERAQDTELHICDRKDLRVGRQRGMVVYLPVYTRLISPLS